MKKIVFILIAALFVLKANAQAGDFTVGLKGAYATKYEGFLYGADLAYQLSPLLELNLSGTMNPGIKKTDKLFDNDSDPDRRKTSLYTGSLDLRFFLISSDNFSTGPILGGSYAKYETTNLNDNFTYDGNYFGFNLGWHAQVRVAENIKINGGWRYTNAKDDQNHHIFYVGVGYAFNLF
ncbi:MAG: porin family protein [Dysgonamonadaceae bacterium]|jgi:opacity protein-like surface antigen|nr:porin family protein [Dysgonamonadaceae bacterium]